jgi:5-methylcytosine-specific restriction endonuclease McrA
VVTEIDVLSSKYERKFPVHCKAADSKALRQKQPRLKLNLEEYTVVRNLVLKRDGWRCQECGAMKNLQIHHMKRRSQLGDDLMSNLITLCASCHGKCHGRRQQ